MAAPKARPPVERSVPEQAREEVLRLLLALLTAWIVGLVIAAGDDLWRQRFAAEHGRHSAIVAIDITEAVELPALTDHRREVGHVHGDLFGQLHRVVVALGKKAAHLLGRPALVL